MNSLALIVMVCVLTGFGSAQRPNNIELLSGYSSCTLKICQPCYKCDSSTGNCVPTISCPACFKLENLCGTTCGCLPVDNCKPPASAPGSEIPGSGPPMVQGGSPFPLDPVAPAASSDKLANEIRCSYFVPRCPPCQKCNVDQGICEWLYWLVGDEKLQAQARAIVDSAPPVSNVFSNEPYCPVLQKLSLTGSTIQ